MRGKQRSSVAQCLLRVSRVLAILVSSAALVGALSASAGPQGSSVPTRKKPTSKPNPRIKVVVAKRGVIIVELAPGRCPKTTAHILKLVNSKFYDGLLFHSVVRGFMAVTGDPRSRHIDGAKLAGLSDMQIVEKYNLGAGGSGSTVPLEPGLSHTRGTLGLKRRERNIDSGDSQIFFDLADNYTNDVAYCGFGKVAQGMDVMLSISQGDRITSIREIPGLMPAYTQPPPAKK